MGRKYFGTDGVRGQVGEHPMTVDFTLNLASAAARVLAPEGGTVLVGKDTRLSGYMFEAALEAGFVAAGVNVMLIGPLPTPGIAYMTKRFECDFGVVISASHNLYDDNGIKFVIDCANGAGYKVGPRILADLNAEIVPIGCSPNGRNINLNCGSTSPELLRMMVPGVGFDVGIALDGDGDRLVMVDHTGA